MVIVKSLEKNNKKLFPFIQLILEKKKSIMTHKLPNKFKYMPNHVHQIKLFITAIDSFEQRFLQKGISQYQLISKRLCFRYCAAR